jgi:hypothetical protein
MANWGYGCEAVSRDVAWAKGACEGGGGVSDATSLGDISRRISKMNISNEKKVRFLRSTKINYLSKVQ